MIFQIVIVMMGPAPGMVELPQSKSDICDQCRFSGSSWEEKEVEISTGIVCETLFGAKWRLFNFSGKLREKRREKFGVSKFLLFYRTFQRSCMICVI